MVGCVQLGAAPDVEVNLHLTPVDYVADALVYISFQSDCCGHAFNLLNHRLMPLRQMTTLMKKAGYPLELLPYEEWCQRLTATTSEENVLRILSCLFTDQRTAGKTLQKATMKQRSVPVSLSRRVKRSSIRSCWNNTS